MQLDRCSDEPGSTLGKLIQIGHVFQVVAAVTVNQMVDREVGGEATVHTERVDSNTLDALFLDQEAGGLRRESGEVKPPRRIRILVALKILSMVAPPGPSNDYRPVGEGAISPFPGPHVLEGKLVIRVHLASLSYVHYHQGGYQLGQLDLVDRELAQLEVVGSIQMRPKVFGRAESRRVDSILLDARQGPHPEG